MKIERILVPVDFSDSSSKAVDHAIEFAKVFGASIDLLHSYQIQPSAVVPYQVAFPAGIFEELREAAKEQLAKVNAKVESAGIESRMHLSQNLPSAAISDAAKDLSSNLIVMGTRGLTGLKHIALGSVAERTVRIAPCPVLTVGHEQ